MCIRSDLVAEYLKLKQNVSQPRNKVSRDYERIYKASNVEDQ